MKTFQIITDSSCDLPQELADKLDLQVLPLHFTIGGQTYANYLDGREIGFHDFFERIRQGEEASTSAVNPESFREAMEKTLQQGLDILFIGFSSGLSTTYQSGCIAADDLREEYPERKILTVDSLCASLGQGLYVYLGALEQQAGKTIEQVRDYLEEIKLHLCHWFTVDDLMYLKRGGRISATTAVLGTVMQIKPVMHMDNDGHLANVTKARGRKASLIALAEKALRPRPTFPRRRCSSATATATTTRNSSPTISASARRSRISSSTTSAPSSAPIPAPAWSPSSSLAQNDRTSPRRK